MKKILYDVYYRENKTPTKDLKWHGAYTKTDALGTANLLLKNNYQVMIIPR